ncbi:cytochrome b/b6 domain-containing protein [Aurantivibrio infirmus]
MTKIKVWDLPVRITHWLFVVFIGVSWWTAEYDKLEWHTWSGYALLTLLLFRIFWWGFFGSTTARFTQFIRGPKNLFSYATTLFKKTPSNSIGHNPLGGLSVVVLLGLMLAQILLGLFSEDVDGLASGPLSYLVSYDLGRWAAKTHEDLFDYLLIFIGLHIAAVFFYLIFKNENLIKPMIDGNKEIPQERLDDLKIELKPFWLAFIGILISSVFVWWLVS